VEATDDLGPATRAVFGGTRASEKAELEHPEPLRRSEAEVHSRVSRVRAREKIDPPLQPQRFGGCLSQSFVSHQEQRAAHERDASRNQWLS
jgi:hypothetical protein